MKRVLILIENSSMKFNYVNLVGSNLFDVDLTAEFIGPICIDYAQSTIHN